MARNPGITGLIMEEGLLWDRGGKGRSGMSIPESDVPAATPDVSLTGAGPDFPDLSEVDVVRHYTRLSQWNYGVDTGMYPLGSCTMKYNPKINEKFSATEALAAAHPMLEDQYAQGCLKVMYELQNYLGTLCGLPGVTLQPAAGAHGELTAMFIFAAYHESRNSKRTKMLIPDTAHGTNPASAAMCGFKPVPIKSGFNGILTVQAVADAMDEETAGIMITNPNTLGLFETNIREIADVVHAKGGLVYGDGANMNAIMGVIDAQKSGIDILHWNVHKTLSTPHGGGGPGAGPICVTEELEKYLPVPRAVKVGDSYKLEYDRPDTIGKVHGFFGNFSVLLRTYSYIRTMGAENLKKASHLAVLNAAYIKEQLKGTLKLAFNRPCMHEVVFSDEWLLEDKVTTLDFAKRLIDYGYHPPTIYFPLVVQGAIMIEPTETECKEDIDQFIDAVKTVVAEAKTDPESLKQAPINAKLRRLDETLAARRPCLCG